MLIIKWYLIGSIISMLLAAFIILYGKKANKLSEKSKNIINDPQKANSMLWLSCVFSWLFVLFCVGVFGYSTIKAIVVYYRFKRELKKSYELLALLNKLIAEEDKKIKEDTKNETKH